MYSSGTSLQSRRLAREGQVPEWRNRSITPEQAMDVRLLAMEVSKSVNSMPNMHCAEIILEEEGIEYSSTSGVHAYSA